MEPESLVSFGSVFVSFFGSGLVDGIDLARSILPVTSTPGDSLFLTTLPGT